MLRGVFGWSSMNNLQKLLGRISPVRQAFYLGRYTAHIAFLFAFFSGLRILGLYIINLNQSPLGGSPGLDPLW